MEQADHKVENPQEVVSVGDEIEVKILRVDTEERKIGLSRKRVEWAEQDEAEADSTTTSAREPAKDLKGGVGGDSSGPLFKAATAVEEPAPAETPSEGSDEAAEPEASADAPEESAETADAAKSEG